MGGLRMMRKGAKSQHQSGKGRLAATHGWAGNDNDECSVQPCESGTKPT